MNKEKPDMILYTTEDGLTNFIKRLEEIGYQFAQMKTYEDVISNFREQLATEVSRTGVNTTAIDTQIQRAEYETIDITVLKRGIIGVNKIGYAPV